MSDPRWRVPRARLSVATARLVLPTSGNGFVTRAVVQGIDGSKREPLWTVDERWHVDEQRAGLEPTDAIRHVLLCASQDRPSSQTAIELSMMGLGYQDIELPFPE